MIFDLEPLIPKEAFLLVAGMVGGFIVRQVGWVDTVKVVCKKCDKQLFEMKEGKNAKASSNDSKQRSSSASANGKKS